MIYLCYCHIALQTSAVPWLDIAGISIEFSGAIITQFCFTYTLEGITAMPRGLRARFCRAFLVYICNEGDRQIYKQRGRRHAYFCELFGKVPAAFSAFGHTNRTVFTRELLMF